MAKNSQRNVQVISKRPWIAALGSIALLILVVLWVNSALLGSKLPLAHDSQNHLARMAQYYVAVREGNIPPIWAGAMNNGFGYPVFLFNYPLANLMALPLIVANISIQQSFLIITLLSVFVSGLGMFYLLREWFGKQASAIGSILYMVNPYQLSLIYVRGVIGEMLSFALLPWVLLMIYRCLRAKEFSWVDHLALILVSALFLLSHNIIVLFAIPLILGFVVWISRKDLRQIKKIVIPGFASVLLVSFFWVPALMEKQSTNLDQVSLSSLYHQHFPTLGQILFSTWGQGFSYIGPVDGMSFGIGIISLILIAWAGLRWLTTKDKPVIIAILIGSIAGLVLLMLSVTQPLWSELPLVSYIQFPWRLLFYVQFLAVLVIAWLANVTQRRWILWVVIVLVVLIGAKSKTGSDRWFSQPDEYWFSFPQTTSVLDENMPSGFDKFTAYELAGELFAENPVFVENTESEVEIDHWTGTKRVYRIDTPTETRVVERAAYFPGWMVKMNDENIRVEAGSDYAGMLSYVLPAGEHQITSKMTHRTMARRSGLILSMVGMMVLVGWSVYGDRFYKT